MKTSEWMWKTALGVAMVAAIAGCHSKTVDAQSGPDPAAANLAPAGTQNEAQQQAAQYSDGGQQPPAPIERAYPASGVAQNYAQSDNQQPGYAPGYADQGSDAYSPADYDAYADDNLTDEQATEPPPPLPEYEQPYAPDPDYLWTPGYWAWGPGGYYWVPGAWVAPPYVGALWTPGYWGYVGNVYRFHHGYWGRYVGFYGGINYGFGYVGIGYEGGYWNSGHFFYNTAVTRVNTRVVRNVYVRNITVNRTVINNRVSYNGGRGGIEARPRPAEFAAMHQQRYAPMQSQVNVRQQASQNKQQFFNSNHGRPAMAVAAHPVTEHSMPAALPQARGPQGHFGNQVQNGARPGQPQQGFRGPQGQSGPQRTDGSQPGQGRPDFRNPQGSQGVPRGGAAPEATRPETPAQPQLQPRPNDVRPQNGERPQTPTQPQGGRPDFHGRAVNPQQGGGSQPTNRPQMQSPFAGQAHTMHQNTNPQPEVRAPQPAMQRPQAPPQQMHQAPPQQMHQGPAAQHAPPAPHAQPHAEPHGGGGDDHRR